VNLSYKYFEHSKYKFANEKFRMLYILQVTELVKHVSADPLLLRGLIGELAEWFAHSKRWIQRQTFALLCSQLVRKQILPEELFARDILPHLLDLSWDPVPNVRLSVARTLATNIMAQGECTVCVKFVPALKYSFMVCLMSSNQVNAIAVIFD
jgi:hypothetical protein